LKADERAAYGRGGIGILVPAIKYREQLVDMFIDTWYDDKYKFYHARGWVDKYKVEECNKNEHQFVSLDKNMQIIGLIGYRINRLNDAASDLSIINFTENKVVFGFDVRKAMNDIFLKYNLRKLTFSVIIGNPVEKQYDEMVHQVGGRIVGVFRENVKLMDNNYYDEKVYEILRSDYWSYTKK